MRGVYEHGRGTTDPTYVTWIAMRQRCRNTRQAAYPNYGGRGIKVCSRWDSFSNFLADMGERPAGMTIERLNNDGNYEPGNCVWATREAQVNNTRRNALLTYEGRTQNIARWAQELGINYKTLRSRLFQQGDSIARAFRRVA